MKLVYHLLFWLIVIGILTITFGHADGRYIHAFYFISYLLPVAMATSYFFNYCLVPRFLLKGKKWQFVLYTFYTLIISLYLAMVALTLALIILAKYQFDQMHPYTTNIFLLTVTIYIIVFFKAFILLFKQYQSQSSAIAQLHSQHEKEEQTQLIVKSDRKNVLVALDQIKYIESLADYIKIHTNEDHVITKEKIGKMADQLPSNFVRVHRSFIVNKNKIDRYTREEITIGEEKIKISRTYKASALLQLS